MTPAPAPENEAARLLELDELQLLDTLPEAVYDDIARLASVLCDTPMATITLVDTDRQWFKAKYGIADSETPRSMSFCAHAILSPGSVFEVPDAAADPRFAAYPSVTGSPNIRFYAGIPIVTESGHALGTLCVIDQKPRTLTREQRDLLAVLARQVRALFDLHRQRQSAQRERYRLEMALDSAKMGLWEHNVRSNAARNMGNYEALLGIEPGTFPGTFEGFLECVHPDDRSMVMAQLQRAIELNDTAPSEFRVVRPGGEIAWIRSTSRQVRDDFGNVTHMIGLIADCTEQRVEQERLAIYQNELFEMAARFEQLSVQDALTGLGNRRGTEEQIALRTAHAARHGETIAVLAIDVDHFKSFNDGFGHAAGDEALTQVAGCIGMSIRVEDYAARPGGEEFVVLMSDVDIDGARLVAERIRAAIESAPWPLRGVTVSIGIALATAEHAEDGDLIERADQALYRAKAGGRNRVVSIHD
jgi:diguanylate cyclase (GGDEF)-like protein/PAS domain S-box-containing protein